MESFTTYSFAISGLLIAQWESALGVDGKQFAQIVKLVGNYFTIWKNLLLSIFPSKHNQFKIRKKCHAIPHFASINQPLPQFQLQNW